MRRHKIFAILIAAALSAIILTPVHAADAYKVGVSMAVTGRGSEQIAPIKEAMDIYFAQVNAAGGINGHPVEIIVEDNVAQPTKAAAQAKQLVTRNKVDLLMNSSLSSTYAPMVQVAHSPTPSSVRIAASEKGDG